MKLHTGVQQVLTALTLVLLLALTFEGLVGGIGQWPDAFTVGQRAQSFAQAMYGLCALLSIVTLFRWREYAAPVHIGFIVSSVAAAGLASVAWGDGSYWSGLLAGAVALVIASLLVWLLRAAVLPLLNREL